MKKIMTIGAVIAALATPATAAPTTWWMLDFAGKCVAAASLGASYESPANAYATVKTLSLGLVEPTIEEKKDVVGDDAVIITAAGLALPFVYFRTEAPCRAADKAIKDAGLAADDAERQKLSKYR